MSPIPYNRSLSGPNYVLRIFTRRALAQLAIVTSILVGVFQNFWSGLIFFVLFTAYQTYLRYGKPAGFDEHLFEGLLAPKHLRPGRLRLTPPYQSPP